MKIIAGDFPTASIYNISGTSMVGVPFGGTTPFNRDTVLSVEAINQNRTYNYAKGGVGVVAGGIVAGPLGALVGGVLPKAFKDHTVEFVVRFQDGRVAHCNGKPSEYRAALKASYHESLEVRDRERVEQAESRAAKRVPGWKAERKARRKAVWDSDAKFSEKWRMIDEVDADYR